MTLITLVEIRIRDIKAEQSDSSETTKFPQVPLAFDSSFGLFESPTSLFEPKTSEHKHEHPWTMTLSSMSPSPP
jgi:hypothetical protein